RGRPSARDPAAHRRGRAGVERLLGREAGLFALTRISPASRRRPPILRGRLLPLHPGGMLRRYANLSGKSGVVAYGIGADFIDVRFRNGETYRYTHDKPGA